MKPTIKAQGIENALTDMVGKSRQDLMNDKECATCDNPNLTFRNDLSAKKYRISTMCQDCQDKVFGMEEI